ncbi:MAG: hypothetical protein WKF84_20715 [Pyrinomonadaceae bacterium]
MLVARARVNVMSSRWASKITIIPTGIEIEKFADAKPLSGKTWAQMKRMFWW